MSGPRVTYSDKRWVPLKDNVDYQAKMTRDKVLKDKLAVLRAATPKNLAKIQVKVDEIAKLKQKLIDTREQTAKNMVQDGFSADQWPDLNDPQKMDVADEYNKLRPPYAPGVDGMEIREVLNWIAAEESHVTAVNDDPVYRFVYKVAGYVGDTVERMLKRDRTKRHTSAALFDVPGTDIVQQLDRSQREVATELAFTRTRLSQRQLFDVLKHQIDLIEAAHLILPRPEPLTDKSGGGMEISNAIGGLSKETGDNLPNLEGIRQYLESKGDGIPQKYNTERAAWWLKRGLAVLTFAGPQVEEEYADVDNFTDIDIVKPYLMDHIYKGFTATMNETLPSLETRGLDIEIERLENIMKSISVSALRQRKAATMDWLERAEVMKTADMNEELFSAVDAATNLVITRIPGMRSLQDVPNPEEILINSTNSTFGSYFVKIAGNLIRSSRFFSGQRASYDKNHGRVSLLNDRIMQALSGYSYIHGKIVNSERRSFRGGHERIAYT